MRNDNIALIHFLWAPVKERWQVLMVDAKAAAPGAKSSIADSLHAELHPPQYHNYHFIGCPLLVGWLEVWIETSSPFR